MDARIEGNQSSTLEPIASKRVFHGKDAETAMSPAIAIPESRRCRRRAAECRMTAVRLRMPDTRDQMLRVAEHYERMGREAEEREIAQGLSNLGALVIRRLGQAA